MVPQLQVVGHVPKKYLPINLFNIHVRLYRCVKIWMVKIWRIFVGHQFQILEVPKFPPYGVIASQYNDSHIKCSVVRLSLIYQWCLPSFLLPARYH